jgi:hypothetical protein
MKIRTITQPGAPLGTEIDGLLDGSTAHHRITFVSAFVGLRTILRLRERLLAYVAAGAKLRFTVGIDLGGTSRDVLCELLRWNCDVSVFHNPIVRATFHPKVYLFESANSATLFVGSNNLTDGGFYTNFEAATRYDFTMPTDKKEFNHLVQPLAPFLDPSGPTVRRLDAELIKVLVARGELVSEIEGRERRGDQRKALGSAQKDRPTNPFGSVAVLFPPLLNPKERADEPKTPRSPKPNVKSQPRAKSNPPQGYLVWRKRLPASDAIQVKPGTNHVGGVRLTQAHFEYPPGQRIDQTTYFRQLFANYQWESEKGGHLGQEHTFVPIRVFIRGKDYGVRQFEISHKPSGEAGQNNYTTILRWGSEFTPTIVTEKLTKTVLSLYETPESSARLLIDIR